MSEKWRVTLTFFCFMLGNIVTSKLLIVLHRCCSFITQVSLVVLWFERFKLEMPPIRLSLAKVKSLFSWRSDLLIKIDFIGTLLNRFVTFYSGQFNRLTSFALSLYLPKPSLWSQICVDITYLKKQQVCDKCVWIKKLFELRNYQIVLYSFLLVFVEVGDHNHHL